MQCPKQHCSILIGPKYLNKKCSTHLYYKHRNAGVFSTVLIRNNGRNVSKTNDYLKKSFTYVAGLQLWIALPKADCCILKGMGHFKLKSCSMLECSGAFFSQQPAKIKITLAFMENNSEQFC